MVKLQFMKFIVELLAYIELDVDNSVSAKLTLDMFSVVEYTFNICVMLFPEMVMFLFSSPIMFNEFKLFEYLLNVIVEVRLYVSVNESVTR